jgi:hypothetical protein
MSNRFEFNGMVTRIIRYLISINGLMAIVFFLSQTKFQLSTTLVMFCLINVSYLATVVFKPFRIIVDIERYQLEIHYFLRFIKKRQVIPLDEVACTFNYEGRAKGGKAKVLKIMYGNTCVAELLPEYSGWDKKTLMQIFEKLNGLKKLS